MTVDVHANSWIRVHGFKGVFRLWFRFCLLLVTLGLPTSALAARIPESLEVVVTASGTFSNVTVVSLTETHVTIKGADNSVATLKRADLDPRTQALLRGEVVPAKSSSTATSASNESHPEAISGTSGTNSVALPESVEQAREQMRELFQRFSPAKLTMAVMVITGGIMLACYLFACYCLMLICKKTGNEPGFLIWLPILKVFPLLRAASMSYGWALAYFSPQLGLLGLMPLLSPDVLVFVVLGLGVLSLVTAVLWCFKITQARGKHWIIALLMLLPVVSLVAFLYLAFSKGVEDEESGGRSVGPVLPA